MAPQAHTADATQLLGALAELGMRMAQRMHDVAHTTNDVEAVARLGVAFHHIGRGVRQSLALQARFASGWVPAVRVAEPAATAPAASPVSPPAPVRERAEATGWNEYERLDGDELLDELDALAELPEDEPVDPARFEAALEAGVARLRRGIVALRQRPGPAMRRPARRAGLMSGAAVLRVVDSS